MGVRAVPLLLQYNILAKVAMQNLICLSESFGLTAHSIYLSLTLNLKASGNLKDTGSAH